MTIADVLTAERERQGLSLNELSRRAGLSAGRVHSILTGATPNPGVLTAARVLAALGKTLGWLERELAKA